MKNKYFSKENELIASIVGRDSTFLVQGYVPSNIQGKIKVGQKVEIKLNEFEAIQPRPVDAFIQSISNTAIDGKCLIDIKLSRNLTASLRKWIFDYLPLSGKAEITLGDRTVLDRLLILRKTLKSGNLICEKLNMLTSYSNVLIVSLPKIADRY